MLGGIINDPPRDMPALLRGRAHGDLHGRNVLVGQIYERVLWPAVYDYGDMGLNNVIAWDFVKMETEFPIESSSKVFSTESGYSAQVVQFEKKLHIATIRSRASGAWPPYESEKLTSPVARLLWLMLMIRRSAREHLSRNGRSQFVVG